MPTLQELNAKIDTLQTALDDEQQQVADLLAAKDATNATLTQSIADLTAANDQLKASGGSDADRQAVSDKLDAIIADIQSTVTPQP